MDDARMSGPGIIGRLVIEQAEVDSTNILARQFGDAGEAEGLAVSAQRQTAGRGRRGAVWFSPEEGGLCLSVLLRPVRWRQRLTLLPLVAALAAAEASEAVCDVAVTLKWPNDLMIGGRKVGGVLCETFGEGAGLFVVVGLGMNVNLAPFDFPAPIRKRATSLSEACGAAVDRQGVQDRFLRRFDRLYGVASAEAAVAAVAKRMPMLGHPVEVESTEGSLSGTAEAIGDDGALIVRTEQGKRITVVSGHLSRYTQPL